MKGLRLYIVRRVAQLVITLYVLATLLFFLFRILPGDPTTMMLDAALPPEAREAVLRQFGLDKPLTTQYVMFLGNLLRGEMGISFHYRRPVVDIIGEKLVNTVFLMGASLALTFLFGVIGGALLAWHRGSRFEMAGISIVIFLRSCPVFWTGMLSVAVFSITLGWFPAGGMYAPGRVFSSFFDKYFTFEFLHHLALPALVSAAYYVATPLLIMRASMMEVLGEDFIEMARAKGLKERVILFRHAVRNALLPVVTVLTLLVGFSIGGQVLVENVFRWPGMGREIVVALSRHDYPITQGIFLLMGALVAILNLFTDIIYGYLDPRVAYD